MGCGASKESPERRELAIKNAKIDTQLRLAKRDEARTIKILLLGTKSLSFAAPEASG
jgi:hypothetical protein